MSSEKTPENDRTVSKTGGEDTEEHSTDCTPPQPQPTPQNTKRSFVNPRHHVFMSPTDAMTSPCTQQLSNRRFIRKGFRPPTGVPPKIPVSKLANKENKLTMEQVKRKEVVGEQPSPPAGTSITVEASST